jgi:hypothetical protein|tara:strand:+ start:10296 stop:10514 length:219 start_codon:yes stop_codon:yes gene_type:complete
MLIMTRLNTILTLSILVLLLPFLGFPQSFDNFLYVIFGGAIFVFSYLLKKDFDERGFQSKNTRDTGGDDISP